MAVQSVTDATFEAEVLRSEIPVLVDLYADWCQPCKQVSPIVAELAEELAGKIKVVKVDVDSNPMVAQTFRAQSIPMLLVIAEGQVVQHHVGALDKVGILNLLEPVMPRAAAEVRPEELALWLTQGKALPVDIRDAASYARYRIPSAIHISASELAGRVASESSTAAARRPRSGARSCKPMAFKLVFWPEASCTGKLMGSRSSAVEALAQRRR
ncbi:MAG: thioredoxin [Deltaproteobacteria bacterium]|nr:thioredoxin [Deltaproteobacteria bacterium]